MNRNERRLAAKGSKAAGTESSVKLPAESSAPTAAALHATGLEHFAAGRHLDAQMCCEKALALDPLHADTLHLTGQICVHAGQYDHAAEWIARAIKQEPKAEYFTTLGAALAGLGRHEDALSVFGKVTELKPDDASAWRILGIIQADLGRKEEAVLSYQQALKLNPDDWDTAYRAGLVLRELGRIEEALACFNLHERLPVGSALKPRMRALALFILNRVEEGLADIKAAHALDPANAEICNYVGVFLSRLGREDEALQWYDRSLDLRPGFIGALSNKAFALNHLHRFAECIAVSYKSGRILYNQKRFVEALKHLNLCDELQPNHALTLQMRAVSLLNLKRLEEGLVDIKAAHALDPANAEICNYVGIFLSRLGREDEALAWYDRVLDLEPSAANALNNKAFSLGHLHRFAECLELYDKVRTIDPNNMRAILQASLVHLVTGNFEAGWAGQEARWGLPGLSIDRFGFFQPRWLGKESIDGKTILVFEDEGAGDAIQFARYVPMLTARGAHVILCVTDPVVPLLAGMPGVAQCVSRSVKAPPAYDLHCPITSLPLVFETRLNTIPSGSGYLPQPEQARQQIWEARLSERLGNDSKLRVGLVWSGNPKHDNDHNRSITLRMLSGLLGADAAFVSLQKDPKPEDAVVLEQAGVIDLTAHLTDFAETAALVSRLDLVITVDTSVAHLAGALGRPTWILLPYLPDWRWLLDRDDSPWYPTVRLFRQDATRDYGRVVARVRSELDIMISGLHL